MAIAEVSELFQDHCGTFLFHYLFRISPRGTALQKNDLKQWPVLLSHAKVVEWLPELAFEPPKKI